MIYMVKTKDFRQNDRTKHLPQNVQIFATESPSEQYLTNACGKLTVCSKSTVKVKPIILRVFAVELISILALFGAKVIPSGFIVSSVEVASDCSIYEVKIQRINN